MNKSDLQQFLSMLSRGDIYHEVEELPEQSQVVVTIPGGYVGFVSVFTFNSVTNNSLLKVEAFE